jgi:hypothetical protein
LSINIETQRPWPVVLRADIERAMLMEQAAALEALAEPTAEQQGALEEVHEHLREIGAA